MLVFEKLSPSLTRMITVYYVSLFVCINLAYLSLSITMRCCDKS